MNVLLDYVTVSDANIDNHTNNMSHSVAPDEIDEQGILSNMLTLRFFVYCSVIVLGIVLNLVVMIVYARKFRKSTYSFLFGLAVVDLCNCLIILLEIFKTADGLPKLTSRVICFAHAYLVDTGCLISAGLVFLLTMNRFLKSKFLKYNLTSTQCLILIFTVVVSAVIVTSPFLIVWVAKLTKLTEKEKDLMCERHVTYHHLKEDHSETEAGGFSSPKLFLLISNAVSVVLLLCTLISMARLYVKMTSEIKGKSFKNPSKLLTNFGNCDPVKPYYSRTIHDSVIIDVSPENSDVSISDIEEIEDNKSGKPPDSLDQNGNKNYKKYEDKMSSEESVDIRRKSSGFSSKRHFPSKILTSRYYCLVAVSLLIFLFYVFHFLFHIINISGFNIVYKNGILHVLLDCLQHSYIVCYILNPIIYSFFNRGFFRNFKKCGDKAKTKNRNRISADSSIV